MGIHEKMLFEKNFQRKIFKNLKVPIFCPDFNNLFNCIPKKI